MTIAATYCVFARPCLHFSNSTGLLHACCRAGDAVAPAAETESVSEVHSTQGQEWTEKHGEKYTRTYIYQAHKLGHFEGHKTNI